jgi:hypothetical protein
MRLLSHAAWPRCSAPANPEPMSGRGFGGWGACGLLLLLLSFASESRAQSTASFPPPAGASASPAPAAPTPSTPPAAVAPRPVAPQASAPAAAPRAVAPQASAPRAVAPRAVAPHSPPTAAPNLPPATPPDPTNVVPPGPSSAAGFYPALLPYRDGLPIPAGYRVEHRSASGLIGGGLASLLIAYTTAVVIGASAEFEGGTGWLVVPVIGPWAAIGARSYSCENDPLRANACVNGAFSEVQTMAILSADAVVQATGAVLFVAGLASGRDELVRSDLPVSVRVSPRAVGATGFGFGVDGRF